MRRKLYMCSFVSLSAQFNLSNLSLKFITKLSSLFIQEFLVDFI